MELAFVGAGYVGLTSAAVFADLGHPTSPVRLCSGLRGAGDYGGQTDHKVWILDVDKKKIAMVREGKAPFFEADLDELIAKGVKSRSLIPTISYEEAIPQAEVVFICVGTPSKEDGSTDLSYVFSAAKSIGKNLGEEYTVVVVKSTVPPGTTERVAEKIQATSNKQQGKDFDVVDSPEFLAEGRAVKDTLNPSRIVIGAFSEKPVGILKRLFKPFKDSPLVVCDIRSAELIKYASNAFLGTKVSFINEIAQIAERVGADVTQVAEGMGLDDRIGPKFLRAGLGYGGSCLPKDVASLLSFSNHTGYEFGVLRAANAVNSELYRRFVEKIRTRLGGLSGRKITVLGLAFKPKTDDMRKAVSVEIIKAFLREEAGVSVYDPMAMENAKQALEEPKQKKVRWVEDAYDALENADCLMLVTEWEEFADLDWRRVKKLMRGNLIADGRNLYDPEEMRSLGFDYIGVGRGLL